MSPQSRGPTDVAASVLARLRALAKQRKVEFQLLLSEFAIERLLYRLGVSRHRDRFMLKGATLFRIWAGDQRRATWDLDLLARGYADVEEVLSIVREVIAITTDDAITFDPASVRGEEIRTHQVYAGVRVRLEGRLARARIPVQLDIAFGDVVRPAPSARLLPVLLGHEPPNVLVYPPESFVAEKVEAMVSLGITNTRMKDFYDVYRLCEMMEFDGVKLVEAIGATFRHRRTPIPPIEPMVLERGFLAAPDRQTQWRAFVRRARLSEAPDPETLTEALRRFLLPVLRAAGTSTSFEASWAPGGPWRQRG